MYTDKAAVQKYLLTNIDTSFDTQLTEWIEAMTEYADSQAGYPIFREDPTTKTYDGNFSSELLIDPVHTITELTIDTEVIDSALYVKWPYNNDIKRKLILRSSVFNPELANVTVEGIHCLCVTLPKQVKWAVTVFVSGIVNQSNNQTDGVKSEKIGDYQVTYKDDQERSDFERAKEIIASYRSLSF